MDAALQEESAKLIVEISFSEGQEEEVLDFIEMISNYDSIVLCNCAPGPYERNTFYFTGKVKDIFAFCNTFANIAGDESTSFVILDFKVEII